MAERDMLVKEKMIYKGLFDFKSFYIFADRWFRDENYNGIEEERYEEKVSGNSRDLLIEWKAFKKLSDYFKLEHKVKFVIEEMTDVEVEIDGKKKSMNKAKVEMEIKSFLVSDWESKWDKSPFFRFWREIYNKYIIPSRVDELEGKTVGDGQGFKEDLKAYLDIYGKK